MLAPGAVGLIPETGIRKEARLVLTVTSFEEKNLSVNLDRQTRFIFPATTPVRDILCALGWLGLATLQCKAISRQSLSQKHAGVKSVPCS